MPRMLAITAALATVLTVAACGSAQPSADGSQSGDAQPGGGADSALRSDTMSVAAVDAGEPGLPASSGASVDDVLRLGAVATWIDAPHTLAISLPAGSDCWPSATEPVVESASRLSLEFVADECGAPQTVRTYTVEVPEGIDAGSDLEVAIDGLAHRFTLTLPAG